MILLKLRDMEDIFHWCREGNSIQVRLWLDDTEHDMNQGYDGFSVELMKFFLHFFVVVCSITIYGRKYYVGIGTPVYE